MAISSPDIIESAWAKLKDVVSKQPKPDKGPLSPNKLLLVLIRSLLVSKHDRTLSRPSFPDREALK